MDSEDLVALYLNAYQAAGRTEQTISWHRHSLTPFIAWLREHGRSLDPSDWSSRIAKLYGKGWKERYVPFCPLTAKAMQRYQIRERRGTAPQFFQSEEGQTLTKSGLYQLCKRISIETEAHLAPHKLRHTFAITYLRGGGNAFALQKLLGHTTLHTTLSYVAMPSEDLISEHREHSPVDTMLRRRG